MCEPLYVFIALLGAVVLGFLFATSILRRKYGELAENHVEVKDSLKDLNGAFLKLQSEIESKDNAIFALQKITKELESKAINYEKEIATLQGENILLKDEIELLVENPLEKVREIDVIREVPILVFREVKLPESKKEKARKLMYAFKKGYLDDGGKILQSSANEQID